MTRDRTGEPISDAEDTGHRCDRGWLDADADRPRPCVHCRPWLRHGAVNVPVPRPARRPR